MDSLYLFAQYDGGSRLDVFGAMSLVWIVAIAASVFWILMLVEALGRERTGNEKFLWALVITLLPFVGALIYLIVRRPGRRRALVRAGRPH